MCNMFRLIVTIKFSSLHDSAWRYSLLTLVSQNTQSDKSLLSLTMDEQKILDQQSPHNELGKHHSSHNLKNRRVCLFVWRFQSDTGINAAVSSVRWIRHQRPPLVIAWIPANGLCDIQTVTDGYEMKGFPSCFSQKRQLIQPRTTKLMSFVWCNIFWIPVTHHPAPACLVFWDGTQDKRAIIRMIW